ncbi:MAG: carbohydrate-binding family 9-like protein [Acidobacteriota bacterium]
MKQIVARGWCLSLLAVCAMWLTGDDVAPIKAMLVEPNSYICQRAAGSVRIDGKLGDAAWRNVPWTESFVDIEGDAKPRPPLLTRVKMLWDDKYFYFAAEMEEPHVWATLTQRDSVIFQDNDFEIFLDPEGDTLNYYEIEINPLNTVWDLQLDRPYRESGKADNGWNATGLKTAVSVAGTINNPKDKDRGWSVELALPWKDLTGSPRPITAPREGERWRVNFSRVEWQHEIVAGKYRKVAGRREDNWVWSPQGEINMHIPEKWGYVQFSK